MADIILIAEVNLGPYIDVVSKQFPEEENSILKIKSIEIPVTKRMVFQFKKPVKLKF
jgi:hypothetical protein